MTISSGFFSSTEQSPRRYTAEQLCAVFDGLISDGIIDTIGDRFLVSANSTGTQIVVHTGRAWFNSTWTVNDTALNFTLSPAHGTYPRYDAVVLEVNRSIAVRSNTIKIITGTPSSQPQYPALIRSEEDLVWQYPLAYVLRPANSGTSVTASNITNWIGRAPTLIATGMLQHLDITQLLNQYDQAIQQKLRDLDSAIGEITEKSVLPDSVSTGTIQNSAVTSVKIANGAITNEKIAENAVSPNKLDRIYLQKGYIVLWPGVDYGTAFPTTNLTEGRLFFKKVN